MIIERRSPAGDMMRMTFPVDCGFGCDGGTSCGDSGGLGLSRSEVRPRVKKGFMTAGIEAPGRPIGVEALNRSGRTAGGLTGLDSGLLH